MRHGTTDEPVNDSSIHLARAAQLVPPTSASPSPTALRRHHAPRPKAEQLSPGARERASGTQAGRFWAGKGAGEAGIGALVLA